MGSSIIVRTISAVTETAVSMSNSTWARPVSLPVGWNKIRLGVRLHMTDSGINLTSTPTFAMGFCSGTTNTFGDATCTHFVGMALIASTWGRTTSPTQYSAVNTTFPVPIKRVGTTNTFGSNNFHNGFQNYINAGAASNTADRMPIFLDITKGNPNYTLGLPFWATNGTTSYPDESSASFLFQMGLSAPTFNGDYGVDGNLNTATLAVNEGTDGTLNAINFYWNRTDALFELCDVAFAVLS